VVSSAAPIHAPAEGAQSQAQAQDDAAAWSSFSAPASTVEFCASWLAILCAQIDRVSGALIVLGPDAGGGFNAVAVWPDVSRNMQYLGSAAEKVLTQRRGLVEQLPRGPGVGQASAHVGYPIEVAGVLHGAVVLDIGHASEPELQRALRLVHWGSAWLVDWFRQQLLVEQQQHADRFVLASDIVATALQERRLGASALAVANDLVVRLGCERVDVGFAKAGSVEVKAISHTATFDARSDFVRLIGEAMDEVLDLDMAMVHPPLDQDAVGGLAHAELSAARSEASLMSVPLMDDGDTVGVLTLERMRDKPFDQVDLALCKTLGLLLGPIFELKRQDERSLWQRARQRARDGAMALFGPRHPGLKLITLVTLVCVVLFSVVSMSYRVTSKTMIEGAVQRAIVSPFQGYVAESLVRAGDTVKAGQVLARLDTRELVLERARWASELEQMQSRYRLAASGLDRAAMLVAAAQSEQSQAQLALVEERLERATLRAPFDGIVVLGDLSQLLGSPVEQGKVLFEVAPLDAYRVVMNVDERDIAEVRVGQRGELALSGIPNEVLPFTVRQITPISTPKDGGNYFRVEAQLDRASQRLRPGMEGVGKVRVGERKVIWIWTHSLVEWLRLWTWKWLL
jgi:RND family efflux transporter MFP subunit